MSDILSQSEIDALLSALKSGEVSPEEIRRDDEEKRVKTYDFKRAMRFSKDQIRSLSRIFENFSRSLTTYFSGQLRTFVQIQVISVEQLPYEEFIRSIPKMTILNVLHVHPLDGKFIMEFNPNIAYAMLERLLGGTGTGTSEARALTEIESTILERVFSGCLPSFQEAWKGIAEIVLEMEQLEVNPQFLQIVTPNETVAVVSLSMKIGDTSGMINICMPHVVLEPIMPKLSAHYWLDTKRSEIDMNQVRSLRSNVARAPVPIIAELGTSTITVGELLGLAVGDVITLDQSVGTKIQVKVGGRVKFLGQPGTYKGRIAVQIAKIVEEGDNVSE
ncbi:flagellar motor switch protein FliM [Collibacillus ludicampi]|uniref:Flagellar motor switch protein FliM n=1 Tax=Collibacillus ludicampi TaxID=2771369 RepID=A0AAV4LJ40_9BACL|nr:flagellar motor switch protein FliM [Collibacillus ludicampi]GIM47809.1 flagellar motor switch protein FliM [Collibacillus ludicampi]